MTLSNRFFTSKDPRRAIVTFSPAVKSSMTAFTEVRFYVIVQELVDVHQTSEAGNPQTKVVEPRVGIFAIHPRDSFPEDIGAEDENGAEVEIISQCTHLAVDDWRGSADAANILEVVRIYHCGARVLCHGQEALEGEIDERKPRRLDEQQ